MTGEEKTKNAQPESFWISEEERMAFEKRNQPQEFNGKAVSALPAPQTEKATGIILPSPSQTAAPKPDVNAGESGALAPTNMDAQWRLACALAQSGALGPTYEGKPGAVLLAMNVAMEKGKNPFSFLQSTYEIKGRITEWGSDALGAIFASGTVKVFQIVYFTKEGKKIEEDDFVTPVWGVAAIGERKDVPVRAIRYFTADDAVKAKLDQKDTYKQYPRRMYETKAVGALAKIVWPDVIAGIEMPDYDEHVPEARGSESPQAASSAKERLTLAIEQKNAPGGQTEALRGVRGDAGGGSLPCSDFQGDSERSPGRDDPHVSKASPRAAQHGLVPIPAEIPARPKSARKPRVGDQPAPIPS